MIEQRSNSSDGSYSYTHQCSPEEKLFIIKVLAHKVREV